MKTFIGLIVFLTSFQVFASGPLSTEQCTRVYRENAISLDALARDFNRGRLSRVDLALKTSAISTAVGTHRLACKVVEDPSNKRCVQRYKEIYKSIRGRISVSSILSGNQNDIRVRIDLPVLMGVNDILCL